eukprot:GHVU01184581.1.p1 GENE.GHVU01184581.1~~GHVU01184581.1.p1  ORF type:complete len:110 (+),score=12.44 GHVU01184581.1:142-471(+)
MEGRMQSSMQEMEGRMQALTQMQRMTTAPEDEAAGVFQPPPTWHSRQESVPCVPLNAGTVLNLVSQAETGESAGERVGSPDRVRISGCEAAHRCDWNPPMERCCHYSPL